MRCAPLGAQPAPPARRRRAERQFGGFAPACEDTGVRGFSSWWSAVGPVFAVLAVSSCADAAAEAEAARAAAAAARAAQVEAEASEGQEPSVFTRHSVDGENGKFETAITTYENDDGVEVSLIAAVHIADGAHYRELQKEFEGYDALLYELVAEAEDRPKPGDEVRGGPIGMLQTMLKNGLELEFQLDAIDYSPANFVHADLTPEGFLEAMDERGESFLTMFAKLVLQQMGSMQTSSEEAGVDLAAAFRAGYGRHAMRMAFASQLDGLEAMAAGGGVAGGTTLLEGRNERALEVLREQIEAGRRKLGIYYGAAHMTGIEQELVESLGFRKVGERWLLAWDITKRPDPKRGKR